MFPNPIIDITDGTTDHDYDLRGIDKGKSTYVDIAATLDLPASVAISHTKVGTGLKTERRTLVSFDQTVEDANGVQGTLRAYCVLVIPEKLTTTAVVTKQVTLLSSFLVKSGFIAKVVAGEI